MGLLLTDVRVLLKLHAEGVRLGEVATLGRQWLLARPKDYVPLLRRSGLSLEAVEAFAQKEHIWSDEFFQLVGATSVQAVDYSDYEGATFIHDMNQSIGDSLSGRFDCVYDGGTLEHVFNFPVAVANAMRMARVGGHVILHNPANNMCGHGFYQFSPELLYRVFSRENGFEIVHMFASRQFREGGSQKLYRVRDPKEIGARVQLDGGYPVGLCVVARKVDDRIPFRTAPFQSDYASTWAASKAPGVRATTASVRQRVLRSLDRRMPRVIQAIRNLRDPLNNTRYFSPEK